MASIPIFDSLSHPTLNSNWLHPRYDGRADIELMKKEMRENNIFQTFAVGMEDIGEYEEDFYIELIKKRGEGMFLPVCFFNFSNLSMNEIDIRLTEVKKKGYVGIKLHPRFGNFLITDPRLPHIIDKANELNLIVLLCTFFYSNKQSLLSNNIEQLGDMLLRISPNSDIVLLHGGLTRLLETMEMVRFFPNALLDLSLTFCKYSETHLDMDFKYIFKFFDRRTCIGTDNPEISYRELRLKFDKYASYTSEEKATNIAYLNIQKLLYKHGYTIQK